MQHRHSLGTLGESSTVSSFSKQKKEKSKSGETRRGRDEVKDTNTTGDKASSTKALLFIPPLIPFAQIRCKTCINMA